MKVAVNLRLLAPGKVGGIESYVRNLLESLLYTDPSIELLLFVTDENQSSLSFDPTRVSKIKLLRDGFCEQIVIALKDKDIDLYFCPLLVIEPLNIALPSVVTIPDVQHEFYPNFFSKEILMWRRENYRASALVADAVLTPSQYSATTISEKLSITENKIFPISHSADESYSSEFDLEAERYFLRKFNLPDVYGYFPANTWPHKNHIALAKALRIYNAQYSPIKIVLTGEQDSGHELLLKTIADEGLGGYIIHLGYVQKKIVRCLYKNASFLVFPSLFEGFGMPVLEAMLSDCPVLCSGVTSLPEIAGDAALYFDPNDPYDIAEAMRMVTSDQKLRQNLIVKGRFQANKFRGNREAEKTLEVFRTLITAANPGLRSWRLRSDAPSVDHAYLHSDGIYLPARPNSYNSSQYNKVNDCEREHMDLLNTHVSERKAHNSELRLQLDDSDAGIDKTVSGNFSRLTKPLRYIRRIISNYKSGSR